MNLKSILLGLVSVVFCFTAFAAESEYTSVNAEDCITLNSAEFDDEYEIDYYEAVCRGQGAYVIKVHGGDLRYGVTVLYRGEQVISSLVKISAFHDLGSEVVEWRYGSNPVGERVLKALIFRISAYELDQSKNLLHVVKLDKMNTCTVSILTDESQDNLKARSIADNIDAYTCI